MVLSSLHTATILVFLNDLVFQSTNCVEKHTNYADFWSSSLTFFFNNFRLLHFNVKVFSLFCLHWCYLFLGVPTF